MNSKAIRKQLLAAVAMVLVAAVALGSSTYAWFVASGSVEATGMKVQAQTESGLLIRGVKYNGTSWVGNEWATSANAYESTIANLHPTSTINLSDWYKASSTSMDDALPEQIVNETSAPYTVVGTDILSTYRRLDTFAIRSASGADLTSTKLAVQSVSATIPAGTAATTPLLNKSIRVGVRMANGAGRPAGANEAGSTFYIFAPNVDATEFELTANYASGAKLTEKKTASNTRDYLYINGDTIPYADTGVMVEIFTWYEGEDDNCKTANITNENGAALDADDLNITVVFEKVDLTAGTPAPVDLTQSGISVASTASVTIGGTGYYLISGAKAPNGSNLYCSEAGQVTSASVIYTITGEGDGAQAHEFQNVKRPTSA